ncbi:MAG: hypothetical protein IID03_12555 [Candidatus Dadabacteria bacterium]|nr:hypothetical protein [Candidatus Dadabacteria bacterium]
MTNLKDLKPGDILRGQCGEIDGLYHQVISSTEKTVKCNELRYYREETGEFELRGSTIVTGRLKKHSEYIHFPMSIVSKRLEV